MRRRMRMAPSRVASVVMHAGKRQFGVGHFGRPERRARGQMRLKKHLTGVRLTLAQKVFPSTEILKIMARKVAANLPISSLDKGGQRNLASNLSCHKFEELCKLQHLYSIGRTSTRVVPCHHCVVAAAAVFEGQPHQHSPVARLGHLRIPGERRVVQLPQGGGRGGRGLMRTESGGELRRGRHSQLSSSFYCTGYLSQLRAKLRDWAVGPVGAGC